MSDLRIIFMGTPEFAVPSLEILVENGFNIAGVITAPDKPAGRGLQLSQSAVKKFATAHDLTVLQPTNLKDSLFLDKLKNLQPDLQVVVAFRMLPQIVWQLPPRGTFNLHASLLPQYRGAAPINWAVINGEKETGVTTFFLQHEIDTGKIIFQESVLIGENETAGELHDRLKLTGAHLVLKTVEAIAAGDYPQTEQSHFPELKKAPKIFTADCRIDWTKSVNEIHNRVRGLSPYPAAFTFLEGKVLKIFSSKPIPQQHDKKPGTIISDAKNYLRFAAADGFLDVEALQLEGKKRMKTDEFLRGHRLEITQK